MQKLKRLLRPGVQVLRRAIEIKAGILLARPVRDQPIGEHRKAESVPTVNKVREWKAGSPLSRGAFEKRIAEGNELYELSVDQQIVSYGWVARNGARIGVLHDLQLKVPDKAFYIWDCATIPEFQGQGHFQRLLNGIVAAHEFGSTALVAVDTRNKASRAALNRAGFEPVFTYFSVRGFGFDVLNGVVEARRLKKAQPRFDQLVATINKA